MRNAAQQKSIREAEKLLADRERARIEFLTAAMNTKQGRVWYHDFLARCHIFNDPFTGDALLEAYAKGERNIGLSIYGDIVTNCPDQFIVMMKEAQINEVLDERRNADVGDDDNDINASDDGGTGSEQSRSEVDYGGDQGRS